MRRVVLCVVGLFLGAAGGLVLALVVASIVGAVAPYEHALRGFVGVLVAFVMIPVLGIALAIRLAKR